LISFLAECAYAIILKNDCASYVKGPDNKRLLKLHGRTDSILIINTQKIDAKPLLDLGAHLLCSFGIRLNGTGQLTKKGFTDIEFCYESLNTDANEFIKGEVLEVFREGIVPAVRELADRSGLPSNRAVENLQVTCKILSDGCISRHGERNKIRLFVDETLN